MSTSNQRYSGVHYNRNGTYWQMRWVDNSGKRQTEGAGKIKAKGVTGKRVYSERQVKVMCKQKEAELAKNPAMIDKRDTPTLSQWCAIYESERHMMTTKTVTPITELTEKLTRYFNLNLKIYEINRNDAANWRTWMRTEGGQCSKPLAESTVCKYVRQAKHMFREAVERDLIAFNPFGRLKDNALLPQDTPETPPTNNTALKPIGSGMTWQDAKEKLETHVKAHNGEFSNVNNLAKIIGCSRPTIKKAIQDSTYLKARQAESKTKKGREVPMSDVVLESTSQTTEADPAERLADLIKDQTKDRKRDERQGHAADKTRR